MVKVPCLIKSLLLLFILITQSTLPAQVELSKYASSLNSNSLDGHYIELFNKDRTKTSSLGNHILITRYYSVRLPSSLRIQAQRKLRLGVGNLERVDLDFRNLGRSFQKLNLNSNEVGDFVLLVSPDLNILDAFYFSNRKDVNFLPDQRVLEINNRSLAFKVPEENAVIWRESFISNNGDPALAFLCIEDQWQISSRNRNMVPATVFRSISANYTPQGVRIHWETQIERECLKYTLERSRDGSRFRAIGSVYAKGSTDNLESYEYYDREARKGEPYFYRVKHEDKFGETIFSDFSQVRSIASENDLSMDYLLTGRTLGVRFSSFKQQKVRIKLMDDTFREVEVLFNGPIKANVDNLIKYHNPLPVGDYYVIAITESQRVYQKIQIREN